MANIVTASDTIGVLLQGQQHALQCKRKVTAETLKAHIQQVTDTRVDHCDPLVDVTGSDFGEGTAGGYQRALSVMSDIIGALSSPKLSHDVLGQPSEVGPNNVSLVSELISTHLDPGVVAVVTDNAAVGAALAYTSFNPLVSSASTVVGRKIMRATAENLVPLSLQVCGKSPVMRWRSTDLDDAFLSTAIGKGINDGQIFKCPPIYYVSCDQLEDVISTQIVNFHGLYPSVDSNPDLVAALNDSMPQRLESYLAETSEFGIRIESTQHEATDETQKGGHWDWRLIQLLTV